MKLWRARLRNRVIAACVVFVAGGGALAGVAIAIVSPANGPVELGGNGYALCMEASYGRDNVVGLQISNHGSRPATMTSVEPEIISNLDVKHVWIFRHPGAGGIGDAPYPPTDDRFWSKRLPLAGYVLKPHSKVDILLRLVLPPGRAGGVMRGAILNYNSSGLAHESTSHVVFSYETAVTRCAADH